MQFDLISDLHVDLNPMDNGRWNYDFHRMDIMPLIYNWRTNKASDILVLAGDISNQYEKTSIVLSQARDYYNHVVFITGNHEYYDPTSRTMDVIDIQFNAFSRIGLNGIHCLSMASPYTVINDTAFIGMTGWYDFNASPLLSISQQHNIWKYGNIQGERQRSYNGMIVDGRSNDSKKIRFYKYPSKLALDHATTILHNIKLLQENIYIKKIVIVTHTVPHISLLQNKPNDGSYYNSHYSKILNAIKNEKLDKVVCWCFGHTHTYNDIVKDDIRFVSNPRGYHTEFREPEPTYARENGVKTINLNDKFSYSNLFAVAV